MGKTIDNLTRDVLEAERLGYGCHYGKYKADHPRTAELVCGQDDRTVLVACAECGTLFEPARNERFCCALCRNRARNRENYRKKKGVRKITREYRP